MESRTCNGRGSYASMSKLCAVKLDIALADDTLTVTMDFCERQTLTAPRPLW